MILSNIGRIINVDGVALGEALERDPNGPRCLPPGCGNNRGALASVDATNDATAYLVGRKMLESGMRPDMAVLADSSAEMKQLLQP